MIHSSFEVNVLLKELLAENGELPQKEMIIEYKALLAGTMQRGVDYIYKNMSYRQAPFRLYDRKILYQDLKVRLLNNLLLASKVAEKNGVVIIQKYKSLSTYFGTQRR